jgi:hypothetical protein
MPWLLGRGAEADRQLPADAPIDRFIPEFDVRERHEIVVHAPSALVLDVARTFDLRSVPAVRAIFWLRSKLLGAKESALPDDRRGLVAETLGMGWGVLLDEPGRIFIAGAACRPWHADVVFTPIPPEQFAAYHEPDKVKIVWTLEAMPVASDTTQLATETRVRAIDISARAKFRRYWWMFGVGILVIRWLLLRAVRREAERRWHSVGAGQAGCRPDCSA